MNRKQRIMLGRIIASAVMMVILAMVPTSGLVHLALYFLVYMLRAFPELCCRKEPQEHYTAYGYKAGLCEC